MSGIRFYIFHDEQTSLEGIPAYLGENGYEAVFDSDIEHTLDNIGSEVYGIGVYAMTAGGTVEGLKRIADSCRLEWLIVIADSSCNENPSFSSVVDCDWTVRLDSPVNIDEFSQIVENIFYVHELSTSIHTKSRRLSKLEAINEIARETLVSRDESTFLWNVARIINEKLSYFNVDIFVVDEDESNIVLSAFAGGYGDDLVEGYSLMMGEGICGWVAQNGTPLLAGDVREEPRRKEGFAFESKVRSELAVPVAIHGHMLGVLHVESEELNAFSRDDIILLETIADQIALAAENLHLADELFEAYELSSTVNDALPVSIILVDEDLSIRYANRTFCSTVYCQQDDVLSRSILEFFSEELLGRMGFTEKLTKVFESGESISLPNVPHSSVHHQEKLLNVTFTKVQAGSHPKVMVLIQDVTEFSQKTRQLSLIREISIAMQGVFDRDKLLHMILTSVTAGFAMGFNRAFLFLINREANELRGVMGVGPKDEHDAYRIWGELAQRTFTLDDYLEEISNDSADKNTIDDLVRHKVYRMDSDDNVLTRTVARGEHIHVTDAGVNPGVDNSMRDFVIGDEFVTMPLIAKSEVIGVLFADNAFSRIAIRDEAIEEMSLFAGSAALAIENAHILEVLENQVKEIEHAYLELEKTHDMLIRHEKLAAVGEVSTRLAHEIRNPLATIGGFAKSIPRKYEDRERTIRNAEIIIEEVRRLESILTNVLDFTKAGTPKKTVRDMNELIKETLPILESNATEKGIVIVLELSAEPVNAPIDSQQIKQVFINVIHNAFNAMSGGGALQIRSGRVNGMVRIEIVDTGCGIPEEFLEKIFDPFFTTRNDGTGLGLAISQRIIQNHNGTFDLDSVEGEGTTITILLPAD